VRDAGEGHGTIYRRGANIAETGKSARGESTAANAPASAGARLAANLECIGDTMETTQFQDLLLQSLEHEMGGVKVYEAALKCVVNDDLREEWEKYHEQTKHHVEVLTEVCTKVGLDPDADSPGRPIVRSLGEALVKAMMAARDGGNPDAAQVVAAECIVLAETKDHLDWELLGKCAGKLKGEAAKALRDACEEIEDEEDEHLYHTRGWCRELWIKALGMKAILPPPEETKDVKTAIGAARAEQSAPKSR
jgi:rubrerythrin